EEGGHGCRVEGGQGHGLSRKAPCPFQPAGVARTISFRWSAVTASRRHPPQTPTIRQPDCPRVTPTSHGVRRTSSADESVRCFKSSPTRSYNFHSNRRTPVAASNDRNSCCSSDPIV